MRRLWQFGINEPQPSLPKDRQESARTYPFPSTLDPGLRPTTCVVKHFVCMRTKKLGRIVPSFSAFLPLSFALPCLLLSFRLTIHLPPFHLNSRPAQHTTQNFIYSSREIHSYMHTQTHSSRRRCSTTGNTAPSPWQGPGGPEAGRPHERQSAGDGSTSRASTYCASNQTDHGRRLCLS